MVNSLEEWTSLNKTLTIKTSVNLLITQTLCNRMFLLGSPSTPKLITWATVLPRKVQAYLFSAMIINHKMAPIPKVSLKEESSKEKMISSGSSKFTSDSKSSKDSREALTIWMCLLHPVERCSAEWLSKIWSPRVNFQPTSMRSNNKPVFNLLSLSSPKPIRFLRAPLAQILLVNFSRTKLTLSIKGSTTHQTKTDSKVLAWCSNKTKWTCKELLEI